MGIQGLASEEELNILMYTKNFKDAMFTKPNHDMYREKPAGYIELPGEWVGYGMCVT